LAVKIASEMTYTVLGGALNSTQSNPRGFVLTVLMLVAITVVIVVALVIVIVLIFCMVCVEICSE